MQLFNQIYYTQMKNIFIVCVLLTLAKYTNACDVCGSAMGGTSLGILPQYHKHFIGMQYAHRNFTSAHTQLGQTETNYSTEKFTTLELRGRLNISKKIQLFFLAPLQVNAQTEKGITTAFTGLGDAITFATYSILQNAGKGFWKHQLQIGGGVKLPTGKYNTLDKAGILNPNIQLGSGSLDFFLNAFYITRYKKLGWSNAMQYKINTHNANGYLFGNRYTWNSTLFYWKEIKKITLLPQLGIQEEYASIDHHQQSSMGLSGGNTLSGVAGVDVYYQKISFGIGLQQPLQQTNTITNATTKFTTTILYNF